MYSQSSVLPYENVKRILSYLTKLSPRFCSKDNQGIKFTHAALQSLCGYPWPGNVRVINLVERLTILYPNKMIDVFDLPIKYQSGEIPTTDTKIRDVELEIL